MKNIDRRMIKILQAKTALQDLSITFFRSQLPFLEERLCRFLIGQLRWDTPYSYSNLESLDRAQSFSSTSPLFG